MECMDLTYTFSSFCTFSPLAIFLLFIRGTLGFQDNKKLQQLQSGMTGNRIHPMLTSDKGFCRRGINNCAISNWEVYSAVSREALKCFLLSSLPFGLLPLCFLVHPSLLYLLLFLLIHPCFFLTLPLALWMSCPRITGACGGLSETCVKGWRRLMGSPPPSSSPSFLPKNPKPVGREKISVSSKT